MMPVITNDSYDIEERPRQPFEIYSYADGASSQPSLHRQRERPDTGIKLCSAPSCDASNTLSCEHCRLFFCLSHYTVYEHKCADYEKRFENLHNFAPCKSLIQLLP